MVTTSWEKFHEYKNNGLVKDVFSSQSLLDKLEGGWEKGRCLGGRAGGRAAAGGRAGGGRRAGGRQAGGRL